MRMCSTRFFVPPCRFVTRRTDAAPAKKSTLGRGVDDDAPGARAGHSDDESSSRAPAQLQTVKRGVDCRVRFLRGSLAAMPIGCRASPRVARTREDPGGSVGEVPLTRA